MAPMQTVDTVVGQEFTFATSKKTEGLGRAPERPQSVVEARVPPLVPTPRLPRRPTPAEVVPSLFNFS